MGLGWLNVKPCMYVRILWAMASAGGEGSQPNQPDVSLVEAVLEPGGRVGKPALVVWDRGRCVVQPTITGWCPASCLLPGFNSCHACTRHCGRGVGTSKVFCRISAPPKFWWASAELSEFDIQIFHRLDAAVQIRNLEYASVCCQIVAQEEKFLNAVSTLDSAQQGVRKQR